MPKSRGSDNNGARGARVTRLPRSDTTMPGSGILTDMDPLIEGKREELNRLCERFNVQRLELFGSAADGSFNPETSDLDFLVEFLPLQAGEHFDAYFGLLEALQDMFHRHIDLVEIKAVRNPYFLESINPNRREIYAA